MARQTVDSPSASTSGIITDAETGQRHIPSSVRADGTTRKEIKIRPGYRPPEDVEVYKNRAAHAFQNRGKGGIPGAEGLKDDSSKSEGTSVNKNAKRREARKKAQADASGQENREDVTSATSQAIGESIAEKEEEKEPILSKEEQEKIDREKQARKLKKKLREAKELQEKKEKGEKLLHEQFEKVIKINELIRDLDKLGFNADGEPKTETQTG